MTGSSTHRTWRQRLSLADVKYSPYVYISPFFILFAIVGLFPLGYTFWVSLHDWHLLRGQGEFVGLGNFVTTLQDRFFWNSIRNTLSIFLLGTIPQLTGALLIAALLDRALRAPSFWRMGVLLPYVVTPVATALIFSSIFGVPTGLVNNIVGLFGAEAVEWKRGVLESHIAIATMINWRWTGYNALILLAAMQAVPREMHEAAAIDGASAIKRFFSVTLPSIRPTFIFVLITATIGGLQIFAEPRLFDVSTAGGIGGNERQFQTTVLFLWEMAFFRQNFGRAAAIAWLLFLLIIVIGVVNLLLSRTIASGESPRRSRSSRRRRKVQA